MTIFGQSGGGAKVWTLMQMPEADGLFHKGIIESGVYWLQRDAEEQDGREIVTAMLKELGSMEPGGRTGDDSLCKACRSLS